MTEPIRGGSGRAHADPVSGTGVVSKWWNESGRFDPRAADLCWVDSVGRVCYVQDCAPPESVLAQAKAWWTPAVRVVGTAVTKEAILNIANLAKAMHGKRQSLEGTIEKKGSGMGTNVVSAHHWAYFDYKDGWVGLRVEPEDQDRADAIKAAIPSAERKYLANLRRWVFKPKWCAAVVAILQEHCPDVPVILEEKNSEVLQTLLVGPKRYLQGNLSVTNPPQGRLFGPISSIQDWPDE